MMDNIGLVWFSPTKTTKRTLEGIVKGIQVESVSYYDITTQSFEKSRVKFSRYSLAVIGVPVYGGRVPDVAVKRLKNIRGDNTPAVIVVVYGNRDYDDALIELRDLVWQQGFNPIAGAAFIGEHSFSTEDSPIAQGRPDENDLKVARELGEKVQKLIDKKSFNKTIEFPGKYPYKEKGNMPDIAPLTNESACEPCEICKSVCPTDAIKIDGVAIADPSTCILCCACIKECPNNARYINDPGLNKMRTWLKVNCSDYKQPETFI
jgi:ferredoxin